MNTDTLMQRSPSLYNIRASQASIAAANYYVLALFLLDLQLNSLRTFAQSLSVNCIPHENHFPDRPRHSSLHLKEYAHSHPQSNLFALFLTDRPLLPVQETPCLRNGSAIVNERVELFLPQSK
jgi:hypothetical protein